MERDIIEGNRDEFVGEIIESQKIIFDNLVRASFVVPGQIVHSGRAKAYVSLRTRWYLPRWKARMRSEKMEWLDLKSIYMDYGAGKLWPDIMIHLTDEDPADLKMIADFYQIARPDVKIEFMEEDDWYDAARVENVIRHNMVTNPRLGSYVISRVDVPSEVFESLEARPFTMSAGVNVASMTEQINQRGIPTPTPQDGIPKERLLSLAGLPKSIHVISVGYNVMKLEPVVEAIVQAVEMVKTVKQGDHLEPPAAFS